MTKERLLELVALEDGCEIGVGGLLVDLGLYKASETPMTKEQWLAAWSEDSQKYQEEYKTPEPEPTPLTVPAICPTCGLPAGQYVELACPDCPEVNHDNCTDEDCLTCISYD